jgi:hypothetical protein
MFGMVGRRDDVLLRRRAGRWAGLPAGRPNRPPAGRLAVWVRVGIWSPLVDRSQGVVPEVRGAIRVTTQRLSLV